MRSELQQRTLHVALPFGCLHVQHGAAFSKLFKFQISVQQEEILLHGYVLDVTAEKHQSTKVW